MKATFFALAGALFASAVLADEVVRSPNIYERAAGQVLGQAAMGATADSRFVRGPINFVGSKVRGLLNRAEADVAEKAEVKAVTPKEAVSWLDTARRGITGNGIQGGALYGVAELAAEAGSDYFHEYKTDRYRKPYVYGLVRGIGRSVGAGVVSKIKGEPTDFAGTVLSAVGPNLIVEGLAAETGRLVDHAREENDDVDVIEN
jgi:hypothetical protein